MDSQVLTGFYKDIYGEQVNTIPSVSKMQKDIRFVEASKKSGGEFVNSIIVSQENGVSYMGPDSGLSGLADRVPLVMGKASVKGSNLLIRSGISYEDAARASSDKKAFASIVPMIIENMTDSISKRLEVSLIYGQSDLGTGTTAAAGDTNTSVVFTFDAGEWSGIWAGAEGAKVALVISGVVYGPFKITVVNFTDKTLKLVEVTDTNGPDGAQTGNVEQVDSSSASIYFYGSIEMADYTAFRDMKGLDSILTTSGSLFGINNSTYALWKGNTVSVTGRLTFAKLTAALNIPVIKGLSEKVNVYVPVEAWQNLNSDQAALRRWDSSYSKSESSMGTQSLKFFGQSGEIEIIAHPFLKESEAFAIPVGQYRRIGANEITFKTPGRGDDIFLNLPEHNGYELRCMTNQALFPRVVATSVKIYGFTNA